MPSQHCRSEELTFKPTTSRAQICFFLELTWGWGGPSSPGTARVSPGLRDMWLGEVMGAAAGIASRAGPGRAEQATSLPWKGAGARALHTEETGKGAVVCLSRGNTFASMLGKKPSTPIRERILGGQGGSLQHPWGRRGCPLCPKRSRVARAAQRTACKTCSRAEVLHKAVPVRGCRQCCYCRRSLPNALVVPENLAPMSDL